MSTEQVFTTVYHRNLWGGRRGEFNSGPGSSPAMSAQYCELVVSVIAERGVASVLDLGCGDFRVGGMIVASSPGLTYTGVDIVPSLIERNQSQFGGPKVSFMAANIVTDDLPLADLVLVRQVLQHLSNEQIATVLGRLRRYPIALVTEHLPHLDGRFVPNRDKVHGPDVRLLSHSAVVIDAPPFDVREAREVLSTSIPGLSRARPESIRTWLVDSRSHPVQ